MRGSVTLYCLTALFQNCMQCRPTIATSRALSDIKIYCRHCVGMEHCIPLTGFSLEIIQLFHHSFTLHHLKSRTRPILTPYDGRCWRDSNLCAPTCESLLYHSAMDSNRNYRNYNAHGCYIVTKSF